MYDDKIEEIKKTLCELALIMLNLKRGANLEEYEFINFQTNLAECLYNAMSVYREISQKEREYIEMKESLDKKDFLEKMQKWKNQKLEIKEVISIGKSIGDSFAYIFYRDSIEELEKHYKHPDNGLFVSGIGGRGEIEFIKENPTIDGYLVVYHSVTNMLRIGDFSVCSLDGKVIGTGEIKSEYINDKRVLASSVYMSSKVKLKIDAEEGEEIYGNSTKEKIQKQLKNQDDLLLSDSGDIMKDKRKMNEQHFLIDAACNSEKGIAYNEEINTLIVAIKEEEYYASENFDDILGEKIDNIVKKMIKDSPYNNIRMEQIGKEYKPYRKPIIWWNISDDIILDILFDKRAIFSVVNFATYYERLTEMGFQIEFKENEIVVGKKCGEYIAKLEGFEMIEDLITHELYTQEDIAEMVSYIVENSHNQSVGDAIVRVSIKRNF